MGVIKERILTSADQEFVNHWQRYEFAKEYVKDMRIVSIACGSGYGEFYLATTGLAESVLGIDNSAEAINYAKEHHQADNLIFQQADALKNNLDDLSADVIVSLETIEHVADDDGLLKEFLRILKPGGRLILSTPNKASSYKNLSTRKPINRFHVREYKKKDLEGLLNKYFKEVVFFGQRPIIKRSLFRLPLYFIYKLSGKIKNLEVNDNTVRPYPTENSLAMRDFVVVCQK